MGEGVVFIVVSVFEVVVGSASERVAVGKIDVVAVVVVVVVVIIGHIMIQQRVYGVTICIW